jgi:hypothetical protein
MRKVPKADVFVIASWEQWSGREEAVWFFERFESAIAFVKRSLELGTGSTYTVVEVAA